jgi:hypothetical protein
MKRAVLALLALGVGCLTGVLVAAGLIVLGAAAFWLFVFGDDPWPGWAESALVVVAALAGCLAGAVAALLTWRASARLRHIDRSGRNT